MPVPYDDPARPYDSPSTTYDGDLIQWRLTQELAEVVVADPTPQARLTQELAEVVVADPTPAARLTQIVVEVVVQRDVAYWETAMSDDYFSAD